MHSDYLTYDLVHYAACQLLGLLVGLDLEHDSDGFVDVICPAWSMPVGSLCRENAASWCRIVRVAEYVRDMQHCSLSGYLCGFPFSVVARNVLSSDGLNIFSTNCIKLYGPLSWNVDYTWTF